eukprot:1724728-Pleurochrysis_carterae.AAC.3
MATIHHITYTSSICISLEFFLTESGYPWVAAPPKTKKLDSGQSRVTTLRAANHGSFTAEIPFFPYVV